MNAEVHKTCRRCKETKPASLLKKDARNKDGFSSFCRSCHSEATKEWMKKNPDKLNATRKARYARDNERINKVRRSKYDYSAVRYQRLSYLYAVSRQWYDEKLAEQGGACAICKVSAFDVGRALSVDHDHSCCKTTPTCGRCNRGLLCVGCNTALNKLESDQSWMKSALDYLKKQ